MLRPEQLKGYKFHQGEDRTTPIEINRHLREGRAAKFWGQTLPQFRAMDIQDQAEATAMYMIEQEIEGYYASESEKKSKKK